MTGTKEQAIARLEAKAEVLRNQRESLSDLLADEAVSHAETRQVLRHLVEDLEPGEAQSCQVCGGTASIGGVPGLHRQEGCPWVDARLRIDALGAP